MGKLLNYFRYENFLDWDVSLKLLEYCIENEINFNDSTVNKNGSNKVDKVDRRSLIFRDLGKFREIFLNRLSDFLPDIFSKLEMSPFEPKEYELEIAVHGDGAFFKEHIDTLTGKQEREKARGVSIVYYFFGEPRKFEGGELRLIPVKFIPGDDNAVSLPPVNNSLVVFPSFGPHEVLPVNAPNLSFQDWRFTINCWLYK